MANNSSIEWTDTTWNPLAGCTRVSPGCDNCYAAKMSLRLEAMAKADIDKSKDPGGKSKYIGIATKNARGVPMFNGKINLDYDELQRPYSWKKPRRVFVNSMSDLFHKDVATKFIVKAFKVMRDTPQHIYQVLTKRPERAAALWPSLEYQIGGKFPTNVWIGTSVEDQQTADERIPELLKIPAAVRFLSCEPLLDHVNLRDVGPTLMGGVHWVITGGESGPNARPMHPDWARSIRDQCIAAGVPFFFKQWGAHMPCEFKKNYYPKAPGCWLDMNGRLVTTASISIDDCPFDLNTAFLKVGKKAADRILDGREWNEFPQTHAF